MLDRLRFLLNRIRERLWVRPLAMCVLSIAVVLVAKLVDQAIFGPFVPDITTESLETLLKIISASMLVIATFAVASMVSAFASASNTATPRAFSLIVSDDVSQNALSVFIGAFIFSIIALIALMNGYYDDPGRFALFVLTVSVFAMVIVTFVRWVDRIARLGRLGETIDKAEASTAEALRRRRAAPTLRGVPTDPELPEHAQAVYRDAIGYIQRVDVAALQAFASKWELRITVAVLPGNFYTPDRPLAYVTSETEDSSELDLYPIVNAFLIRGERIFDEDPRFGLIVLSEIASRALSPAVNDPGTAIDILGSFVRLLALWGAPQDPADQSAPAYDRIAVPQLSLRDLFDDAFTGIARDGAGSVEVAIRLQKALTALARTGNLEMREVALEHARMAFERAANAMTLPDDLERLRKQATLLQPR